MNRNQTQAATNASSSEYFDLHVRGCGYLNRIREVRPQRGDPFLACSVSALHGRCMDPEYSYFDLKVSGEEAQELVRNLKQAVSADRKVFVAFRAGDIYADPYEADERDQNRQKTGRKVLRATIKGRMLQITHAKVDGEVVFQSDRDSAVEENAQAVPLAATAVSPPAVPQVAAAAPQSNNLDRGDAPRRAFRRTVSEGRASA